MVQILIVTKNGYGKRTPSIEYRVQSRGGKGIKTCNITEKNGDLVAMRAVTGEEDLMLITTGGVLIRLGVNEISSMGRSTQGVRLIRLDESENEYVATVAKVEKEEDKADEIDDEELESIESSVGEIDTENESE